VPQRQTDELVAPRKCVKGDPVTLSLFGLNRAGMSLWRHFDLQRWNVAGA
jgi:hypothetical protein